MYGKTTLERAFELADQGLGLSAIRVAIQREGYEHGQLYGLTIATQLSQRILAAKGKEPKRGPKARPKPPVRGANSGLGD